MNEEGKSLTGCRWCECWRCGDACFSPSGTRVAHRVEDIPVVICDDCEMLMHGKMDGV